MVDPAYRNKGAGSVMVREGVVDIAYDYAMDSVVFVITELMLKNWLDY